jgi:phosphomannomutase
MRKLILFDLDGTLASSKSSISPEISRLLVILLRLVKVEVISGGAWPQFQNQLLAGLGDESHLGNLSLPPSCGTKFFSFTGQWRQLYSEDFTADEKNIIFGALNKAIVEAGVAATRTWGDAIEDRGSQITYSALGQQAPLKEKVRWDPDFAKRKKIIAILDVLIPQFSVRMGGSTSIDITKPGIDKGYGIRKLQDTLAIPVKEMIFIGDALFPGGNDYPAFEAGVESIPVRGPENTALVIKAINACLSD